MLFFELFRNPNQTIPTSQWADHATYGLTSKDLDNLKYSFFFFNILYNREITGYGTWYTLYLNQKLTHDYSIYSNISAPYYSFIKFITKLHEGSCTNLLGNNSLIATCTNFLGQAQSLWIITSFLKLEARETSKVICIFTFHH